MTRDDGESFDTLLRAVAHAPNVPIAGTTVLADRFLLERRLGEGGFGVVYQAKDLRDGGSVALKLLRHPEADWFYRFKREFRALQGLVHPNLVVLDELFGERDVWFFTMELVDGVDFIRYASDDQVLSAVDSSRPSGIQATRLADISSDHLLVEERPRPLPFDEPKLRDALRQLFEALAILHRAGKVHRDIKPSNVLVTPAGRVVLIDFGLITEAFQTTSITAVGTAAYMAPEQAASREVGPAADLYAVGVMLYQLFTGRMPIEGPPLQILIDKQSFEPAPPASLASGIPADLNALCVKLLQRDPERRPSTAEVCRSLIAVEEAAAIPAPRLLERGTFVGRSAELSLLNAAFDERGKERLATVLVTGESGIGKTSLVRRFLTQLKAEHPTAVLLEGRCYEREAIPYKGLDGIIDALSRRLSRMPARDVAALLPTRRNLLAQVFPALLRVPGLAGPTARPDAMDAPPSELRGRAFLQLRELFTRVAMQSPTVIFIDDLQWADDDGLRALGETLRSPDAPALLFIGALRVSGAGDGAMPDRLHAIIPRDARRILVEGLEKAETCSLVATLLERASGCEVDAERIATEAGGHPLFVEELARRAASGGAPEDTNLERVIWSRVLELGPPARAVVELLAVAGKPLTQELALAASDLEPGDFQRLVAVLRASNLVQTSGALWSDRISPYHDRVRGAALARLEPEACRRWHRALAQAFEASPNVDPETLAVHWQEAGDSARAARHAASAGHQAARMFAFDRAAAWFEQALELLPKDDGSRRELRIQLGGALAAAGRGALAAPHFEAAAAGGDAVEALELRRRAAEQLLRSGHVDRGIAASRAVLASIGMRIPTTRFGTLVLLVYYTVLLRLRGLKFRQRDDERITALERTRIDICFSMGMALGFIEPIVGFVFQRRALLLALAAGDLERAVRSLCMDAGYVAMAGGGSRRRTNRLVGRTCDLAERSGTIEARTYAAAMTGFALYLNGRFREAAAQWARTLALLEENSTVQVHERVTAHRFMIQSLVFLGRFREVRDHQRTALREALAREDVYAAVNLRIGSPNITWLIDDRPDLAESEMNEAMRHWPTRGFHLQHCYASLAAVRIGLYVGDRKRAHSIASELLYRAKRSLIWRMQIMRFHVRYARGASALGLLAQHVGDRRTLLRATARDARAIEREGMGWMLPFAKVLRAGISLHEGTRQQALDRLHAAAREYDEHGMTAYASAARDRAVRLCGDASTAPEVARIAQLLKAEDVVNPERLIAALVPGFIG